MEIKSRNYSAYCEGTGVSVAKRNWLDSRHKALRKALLVLLATAVGGATGCAGQFLSGDDGDLSRTDRDDTPSYSVSLDNGSNYSRQASYTMRGRSGEVVTSSFKENSQAVLSRTASNKKPLTYFDTILKSSLGQGLANSKLEFANSSRVPYDGGEFDGQNSSSLFRYNLNSTGKEFRYGLQYFSIGKGFTAPGKNKSNSTADKEGTEFWGRWRLGDIGIKPLFRHSYNNLEADPDRARLTDNQVGLRLDHTLMSWPYLGYSVSYLTGTRESSLEPENYEHFSGPISTATLSVDYSANTWNASLSSSRSDSENTASGNSNQNITYSHYLTGSYYPNKTISVTGSLGQVRDEYKQWDATTLTNDASLSLNYKPISASFDRYAYASYSGLKNPDWQLDTHSLSVGAGQRWYLTRKPSAVSAVSFDVSYDQYLDDVYSEASTKDLTLWLRYSYMLGAKPLLASRLAYLTTPSSGNMVPVITRPAAIDVPQMAQHDRLESTVTTAPDPEPSNHPPPSEAAREMHEGPSASPSAPAASVGRSGAQDAGQYTIQLLSSTREQDATNFIRRHQLNKKAEYAAIEQDGVTSYKVFYGVYPDLATATAAANALSPPLQQFSPFVRKISVLRTARK